MEVSRLEMPWEKQGQIALDRGPDYEAFRYNNTLDKPIQGPRNEIFVSHHAKVVELQNHWQVVSCSGILRQGRNSRTE